MAFRYPNSTGGNVPSSNLRREAEVEQPSSCRPCGLTFNSWEALHNHKRRHPQHRKTYCDKCTKDFATEDATEAHCRLFHGAEQYLPCPHCERVFPRLGGLIHHIESKQCPAAEAFELKERVEERMKHYENWDNVLTRVHYGKTTGDFSLPPVNFSSGPPTPQLQAKKSPQSPATTYTTHEASDADVQSNVLDDAELTAVLRDTQLTAQSDSGTFFDPNEDLISFDEPKDDSTKAPTSQQPQPAQDCLNFPTLGGLSLNAPTSNKWVSGAWAKPNPKPAAAPVNFPALGNPSLNAPTNDKWVKNASMPIKDAPPPINKAWTSKPSIANVNNTKPVTPAILSPRGSKQPPRANANSTPPPTKSRVAVGPANIALANMNATAQAPAKKIEWHPFDPDRPGFDATPFYHSYLRKYKCPYRLCTKSVEKEGAFIQHLKSSTHNKNYQCKKCLNHFATISALTQHSESQSNRCVVRQSDFYGGVVDEFTGGIAAPVGLHPDKTTRYIVNDIDAIIADMKAPAKKELQEGWDRA